MSKIKGDIQKAIGISSIEIKGIEFDISDTKLEDIVEFKRLPFKYLKMEDEVEGQLNFEKAQIDWIIEYLHRVCNAPIDEALKIFVTINHVHFVKELTIGMGLNTRAEYEASMKAYIESKSKK